MARGSGLLARATSLPLPAFGGGCSRAEGFARGAAAAELSVGGEFPSCGIREGGDLSGIRSPSSRQTPPGVWSAMKMLSSPWARFYSNSCCLCCHVRTGTIILGVWYLIINSVVLLVVLSALTDPGQYHLTTADLGGDFEFMDDANMCIATAISLLMILICAMATYGAYKQHAAWIIPFFCYQIFDFALNTLVAISVLVYPNTIQDYLQQLPANFPYKEEIMSVNPTCLVVIILLFISIILAFKAYLISCVWNCYRYINNRNSSDVLVYITTNDTAVLLPPYDDPTNGSAAKDPPPPYVSA